ncbi:unnamed protein product [Miscanthus lutarioriparius]|uniref:Uncharacterized protein n=1 Tax=Miscanthus lutarioriparius TaxID=422564 RepID=A0A811PK10_9POAL|nr:unnamed protein product [Miscanthus lutarioriparius]
MDGGFGARCYHIDDSTAATGRLLRRRKWVKRERDSFDYYDDFSDFRCRAGGSRLDSDDDHWLAYEAPLLPGKRRCTAVSSSTAAVNPGRCLRHRSLPQPPRPRHPACRRTWGRAAPPVTGVVPRASSSYLRLMRPRRSTAALLGSVRPSSGVLSMEGLAGRSASAPKAAPLGKYASVLSTEGLAGRSASTPKAAPLGKYATSEKYGRDMTAEAGKMDPVIGRDDEIDRVVCILCRRTKNSAMLVGAPGVGKTAIAEGLAQRIAAGAVPSPLVGARVVEVDLGAMVAGTQYRGMFEERMKKVIQQAEAANGKVVLFIDEVHMLLGAGQTKGGSMDGANLLKPALARGRIRCIGATTFDEHRKYVEKDAAFERRFQKVHVQEPSVLATIDILQGLKKKYEEHHGAAIQDAAIVAAAQLANRYITGRQFPDKAIDLIDEACATARMQRDNILKGSTTHLLPENVANQAVSPGQIAEVVSRWTSIPVNTLDQDEKERLMHLADRLRERVVGQDAAVNSVAQAVLSYHGHQDGGQLTEKVRQQPYSVILFDEIEKADPAVFNVFLQLLDDGLLTDGKGRTVDFKNTTIIMTSNLGAEYLMEAISGEKTMEAARDLVIKQAQKHFRPEFLNRLSELVVFEPLSQDKRRKHYGARPIRRWLQKNVMTKLSEMLFKGEIDADTAVIIDACDDKKCLKYEVVKNVPTSKAQRHRLVVEIPSDSDSDDDGVELTDPIAKKMKGIAISSSEE